MTKRSGSEVTTTSADGGAGNSGPPKWLPIVAILVISCLWPIIGIGAKRAWESSSNRVEDWLPESLPETKSLIWFLERFGSDEFLMISWEGCNLADTRTAELERRLLEPSSNAPAFFYQASTGSKVIDQLATSLRISEEAAKSRVVGLLVGPDRQHTCLVARLSEAGINDRKAAIDRAWMLTKEVTGLSTDDIHIAGTTADSIAVDQASNQHLVELNVLSAITCIVILLVSLRSIWLVITVFLSALFQQHLALAVIHYSGGHVDSIQLLVANLCFVLSISAGLHFLGYFRDAVKTGEKSPGFAAVKHAFIPSALAAGTTSLGFVSLCTSQLNPIRQFGLYSAILVPLNAAIVVTLLAIHAPWASQRDWLFRKRSQATNLKSNNSEKSNRISSLSFWIELLVRIVEKRATVLVLLFLSALILFGAGSRQLQSSVGTQNMLPADSKLIQDYKWLENRIGPLIPIELAVRFQKGASVEVQDLFSQLQALDKMRRLSESIPEIDGSFSALTFLPALPTQAGMRATVRRAAITQVVNQSMPELVEQRLVYEDFGERCWRISCRVRASETKNYEEVLSKIQQSIDQFRAVEGHEQIVVDISGGIPFIYRTQRQLLLDLLGSFTSAFAMIAITLTLVFRSLGAGLLLMIPNVAPAAFVFGAMGWFGIEIELGTVLTASVMMGICVDDTLHLVSHFRSLRSSGLDPRAAVVESLKICSGAVLQTALVCGIGMLAFALSPFTPVARFAWLTFALLMVGALGDAAVTPALMLSPLNKFFYRDRKDSSKKDNGLSESTVGN